jgi:hypothetical protein
MYFHPLEWNEDICSGHGLSYYSKSRSSLKRKLWHWESYTRPVVSPLSRLKREAQKEIDELKDSTKILEGPKYLVQKISSLYYSGGLSLK